MQALERVLQDDPSSAALPVNGKPVLVFAMSRQCSLATLRVLLDYGAQLNQETLNALLAMTVPDAFEGNFQIYEHAQPRSCPVTTRLHVRYAIFLLNLGVRASPHAQVGYGNEACAHCARSYIDATAAAVLRRSRKMQAKISGASLRTSSTPEFAVLVRYDGRRCANA